jgi:LCP family protein required for cell wall assembly
LKNYRNKGVDLVLSFYNKNSLWKTLKLIALVTGCFLVGASAYLGYLYNKANAAIEQISAPAAVTSSEAVGRSESSSNPKNEALQKPTTFLLTAIDDRKGNDGSLNTDVMMLVSFNPQTHSATIVSLPRDIEVKSVDSGLEDDHKLNYFYAFFYNKDKDSAMLHTKEMFSKLYHLPIDYMAVINFDGFHQLIDQLGGMKVDVDMDMKYTDQSDGTSINLKEGYQTLDGKQTLDFLRYRKSNQGTEESSDLVRNERQQKVLDQIVDKVTSLSGISGLGQLLDIAASSIQTDIPAEQLKSYATSYRDIKPDTIEFIHLDGEWESPYIVVKSEDLVHAEEALQARLNTSGASKPPASLTDKSLNP